MDDLLTRWHQFVSDRDVAHLSDLLADEVVFRPPTYWKTRQGKPTTMLLLSTVMGVFEDFEYHRQWINDDSWALEFSARIGEFELKGVDLMRIENGQIVDLEVLIRPPNAVLALRNEMGERLAALGGN